jgi:hypothetical protein
MLACGKGCKMKQKTAATSQQQSLAQTVKIDQKVVQNQATTKINKTVKIKSTRDGLVGKLLGLDKPKLVENDKLVIRQ